MTAQEISLSLLDLLRVIHSNKGVILGYLYPEIFLEFPCGTNGLAPELDNDLSRLVTLFSLLLYLSYFFI
jgi:hypothetical protein